ncbi:MAG: ABC transporter ATP-binding protein [Bacteroidetes bacterium]|nr:MAG: ABC transporter ATP-binding protein [Bacteroidota bacterium]RLD68648.1 MAG: ABC transporter ATP-binding protein [Bacteroidota bacterium]RLD96310.1 MAG: ABC transporter ATP-binding protein [Bacteroidota bacterium]RLE06106.1 MAG: ABC transporter ATP-binding protein [Bacteroidota bacterium]
MIEVKNLFKSFEGEFVLNDVSARFEPGKCNLIIGRSGSGKTVLLKSIAGLIEVDQGEIWYDDQKFSHLNASSRQAIRKEMGVLFQGAALFDSLTVEENVLFPLDMFTHQNRKEKLDRANFCLERVKVTGSNGMFPAELSGGMKKRVAIARAIALNPKYLLCDEPNSGLDPETGIIIDNLIKELTVEFQMTTIVNSHDMNSVLEIGDKVIFIFRGCKSWEGSREEILKTDNEALNKFVFATNMAKKIKKP